MVHSSHSRCMILTWGWSLDPLFPTSKADMWSLWVGRVLHTLVTYIAETNGDPWRIGTQPNSNLVECQRNGGRWTHTWKGNLVFYLNSLFTTLSESGIFFSFLTLFFREWSPLSFADMIFILWSFMMRRPCMGWLGIRGDFGCMTAGGWCLAVDVNTRSGWLTDQTFKDRKQWVRERDRSVDGKFHFLDGHTVQQSSW